MTITTTMNIDSIRRLFAVNLSVSRKQKPVLKRLKACKPCGRGNWLSVALALRRPIDLCFQEVRTDQWISFDAFPDQP